MKRYNGSEQSEQEEMACPAPCIIPCQPVCCCPLAATGPTGPQGRARPPQGVTGPTGPQGILAPQGPTSGPTGAMGIPWNDRCHRCYFGPTEGYRLRAPPGGYWLLPGATGPTGATRCHKNHGSHLAPPAPPAPPALQRVQQVPRVPRGCYRSHQGPWVPPGSWSHSVLLKPFKHGSHRSNM